MVDAIEHVQALTLRTGKTISFWFIIVAQDTPIKPYMKLMLGGRQEGRLLNTKLGFVKKDLPKLFHFLGELSHFATYDEVILSDHLTLSSIDVELKVGRGV